MLSQTAGERVEAPDVIARARLAYYLYCVWFQGDSSTKTKSRFNTGLGSYYQHAKQQTS